MKRKVRSSIQASLLLMMIIMHRTETKKRRPVVKIEMRITTIIMMKMNARKEKGAREAEVPLRLEVEQIETKVRLGKRGNKGPEEKKKRGKKNDEGPERFRVASQSRRRDHCGGVVQTLGANISYFVPTNRDIAVIWVCISGAPIVRRILAKYHNSSLSMGEKNSIF